MYIIQRPDVTPSCCGEARLEQLIRRSCHQHSVLCIKSDLISAGSRRAYLTGLYFPGTRMALEARE